MLAGEFAVYDKNLVTLYVTEATLNQNVFCFNAQVGSVQYSLNDQRFKLEQLKN